jgi:hypothetical protein
MALIQVTAIEGVFTPQQKEEIIERLTDATVTIEGANMRQASLDPRPRTRRISFRRRSVGGTGLEPVTPCL